MSKPSLTHPEETRRAKRRARGQTLAEFGITISLLMVVLLGIFQVGYLIYQQYVALNLAREGTKLILSVIELGPPGPNEHKAIITHRHAWGMPTGTSVLGEPPSTSYKTPPD